MTSPTPSSERRGLAAHAARAVRAARRQEGFTLAALIVILTIISIIIAFTVPEQWSMVMRRERDKQTIFLMKQFARSIWAFQQKNGNALPTSLQQLQDARTPRLIRGGGKWPCPLNGKIDGWILVPQTAIQAQPGVAVGTSQPQPGGVGIGNQSGVATILPPSKLIKEASPRGYTGPFVGVRPDFAGKSFIAFNGVENYDEWVYTVQDLRSEMMMRQMAMAKP